MSKSVSNFFATLTPEILSPSDFVNWDGIRKTMHPIRREIALLKSVDLANPVADLGELINKNPAMLKVLQLLIAHTPDSIEFRDGRKCVFDEDMTAVSSDLNRAKSIAQMFVDVGLPQFLSELNDVGDVVKGVLVGLQPNSRKSLRGKAMEREVTRIVESVVAEIRNETGRLVAFDKQMYIELPPDRKKVDNLIVLDGNPKIAIETNFYSTAGSKPSETLNRAYPDIQGLLRRQGVDFIVVTDGLGWTKMKPTIEKAFTTLTCVMNLHQAEEGEMKKAISRFLKI